MWAVWQNGLEVLVCVLALRKLCFNWDGLWASGGHPVASRHLSASLVPSPLHALARARRGLGTRLVKYIFLLLLIINFNDSRGQEAQ